MFHPTWAGGTTPRILFRLYSDALSIVESLYPGPRALGSRAFGLGGLVVPAAKAVGCVALPTLAPAEALRLVGLGSWALRRFASYNRDVVSAALARLCAILMTDVHACVEGLLRVPNCQTCITCVRKIRTLAAHCSHLSPWATSPTVELPYSPLGLSRRFTCSPRGHFGSRVWVFWVCGARSAKVYV